MVAANLAFNIICWSLSILYLGLSVTSLLQLMTLLKNFMNYDVHNDGDNNDNNAQVNTSAGGNKYINCNKCSSSGQILYPYTIQQKIHYVVLLLCSLRVAFFTVAVHVWDPQEGIVVSDRVAFYTLDEFATILFFTLTSILALFWTELYFISVEKTALYLGLVRPTVMFLNLAVLVGISVNCYYVSTSNFSTTHVDYLYYEYSILVAVMFFVSAIFFAFFSRRTAAELEMAPIYFSARLNRIYRLEGLAAVNIVALIARGVVLIVMTGKKVTISGTFHLTLFVSYYMFLEWAPILIAQLFYMVPNEGINEAAGDDDLFYRDDVSNDDDGDGDDEAIWERHPLTGYGTNDF